MSDGDWDAEDYDAPVVPTASKSLYADEDAEDDVKVCVHEAKGHQGRLQHALTKRSHFMTSVIPCYDYSLCS